MSRARLATLALAAGLGLVSGCASLSEYPPFSLFGRNRVVCCPEGEMGGCPCGTGCAGYGGPLLDEGGPMLAPGGEMCGPGGCGLGGCAPGGDMLAPGGDMGPPPPPAPGIPPLAPPPRLVPQPQQAPPEAYSPTSGRIRRLGKRDSLWQD